jgi:hypothetical protein
MNSSETAATGLACPVGRAAIFSPSTNAPLPRWAMH